MPERGLEAWPGPDVQMAEASLAERIAESRVGPGAPGTVLVAWETPFSSEMAVVEPAWGSEEVPAFVASGIRAEKPLPGLLERLKCSPLASVRTI